MKNRRTNWHGVFVPMVTPFTKDYKFDEKACRQIIEHLIADGVNGIIVAGSTGEWFTMTNEEKIRLFEVAKDQVKGRVILLGGSSAIATRDAVALTKAGKDIGLDGTLLLPPPYALPNEIEFLTFFETVGAVGLPIMVYNNPPRTSININAALIKKLTAVESIVALKDSVKDLYQMSETIRSVGDTLAIFCGLEPYAISCIERGAVGIVAMTPNVIGRRTADFYNYVVSKRWSEASEIERLIDRLYAVFYAPGNTAYVVIKECMNLIGRPAGWPRPPLLPVQEDKKMELKRLLEELGLLKG
jgi:4-hydroxy-tetrahydrodipicolinate synthase